MRNYKIFSDSSCDLLPSLLGKHDITLIPFYVSFDLETYHKENVDITNEEFYLRLSNNHVFPKTSLPSVQDYLNSFQMELSQGRDILCLCLTQKFSGSYQSAVNARLILEEKYPDNKIYIVDSIQATVGEGLLLLQAAYMKEAGCTISETVKHLNRIKTTARIMFTVDTLEYLTKGGRVGKVASLAGTILNLKPLIQLKDAELIPYGNVRGRKKSLARIPAMVEEYFQDTKERYEDYDFAIANSTCYSEAQELKSTIETLVGKPISYPIMQIGITIGTYTGPGALGVCFVKKYNV